MVEQRRFCKALLQVLKLYPKFCSEIHDFVMKSLSKAGGACRIAIPARTVSRFERKYAATETLQVQLRYTGKHTFSHNQPSTEADFESR